MNKPDVGDVRGGSTGDVFPLIVVGTEVYDDEGNLVRPLLFHVEQNGVRVSNRLTSAGADDAASAFESLMND